MKTQKRKSGVLCSANTTLSQQSLFMACACLVERSDTTCIKTSTRSGANVKDSEKLFIIDYFNSTFINIAIFITLN